LKKEFRTVKVFLYITVFTDAQRAQFNTKEEQETTDEYLNKISTEKETINSALTKAMKESAFDCNLYPHDPSEGIKCLRFGEKSTEYSFKPSYSEGINENLERQSTIKSLQEVMIEGKSYLISEKEEDGTFTVYNKEEAERGIERKESFRARLSKDGVTYKKTKKK
jgi:hypothetical protein